jgi:hypothetical protein
MRAYIVGRGEDLESIAARLGFDAQEVWNASENQELREQRGDPQVLAPGDVLYVPDVEETELAVRARTTNEYTADIEYVEVNLALSAGGSEARANEPYEIHGLRSVVSGSADGEGNIRVEVPAHVRTLDVRFPEQQSAARVRLGHLDPTSESTGVRTRLHNLGHLASGDMLGPRYAPDRAPAAAAEELRQAVLRFQEALGLKLTGELDEPTSKAIRDRHGS